MDLEAIRTALHGAVDKIIDDCLTGDDMTTQSIAQPLPTTETPLVTRGNVEFDWTFTWPGDEGTETFHETSLWDVVTPHDSYLARLAWGTRRSWGKEDRRRAIVFGQIGPNSFYP